MFHNKKEEQIRQLQIDGFIATVLITSSGGRTPNDRKMAALEATRKTVEDRFKAEIALESSKKRQVSRVNWISAIMQSAKMHQTNKSSIWYAL